MKVLPFLLLALLLNGCSKPVFRSRWAKEKSPETFVSRFETSKGIFDVEVTRNASPKAVDRFYQMMKHRFYDNALFYRVDSNFVAQFGSSDTVKAAYWRKFTIPDEEVIAGNKKGSISYARGGKETRGRELFINLNNNPMLDTLTYSGVKGFPAFGHVIKGMEVVESLYYGYDDNTMGKLDTLYFDRVKFLQIFPKLDSITKAYIIKVK